MKINLLDQKLAELPEVTRLQMNKTTRRALHKRARNGDCIVVFEGKQDFYLTADNRRLVIEINPLIKGDDIYGVDAIT